MPRTLTSMLYRFGLHHEDGATSLASLGAGPARLLVGEVAASAADVVTRRTSPPRSRPAEGHRRPPTQRPGGRPLRWPRSLGG